MDLALSTALGLALAFVLVNGFFVASEFAIVKVRATRLRELARDGSRRAAVALRIGDRLDAYLSANQLGITLASLALGALEPSIARAIEAPLARLGPLGAAARHGLAGAVAFFGITFLHTVLGELAPKSLAIAKAETTALVTARPLHAFFRLMYPVIALLNGSARLVLRLIGLRPATGGEGAHSEDELRMIVASSHAHGVLDRSTRELLEKVLAYRSRIVREVMTPRADVTVLNVRASFEENLRVALETGYTRYPLWDEVERRVVGFVHVRDILTRKPADGSVRSLGREAVFVPETIQVDRMRRLLQRRRVHFAVVVDEYGEFVGIASLEDALEEIVGDIEDEFDEAGAPRVARGADGTLEIDGGLLIEELQGLLEASLPERPAGVDTVAGYVLNRLGRLPDAGEVVEVEPCRIEVLAVDRLRIRRLRVRPRRGPEEPPVEGGAR